MDLLKGSRALACAAIAYLITSSALAQNSPGAARDAQSPVLQTCQSCHGANGNSKVGSTPRLNGQQAEYIIERFKALSEATRNPHAKIEMFKEPAAQNDATMAAVAKYFASQPPTDPVPSARASDGKHIYETASKFMKPGAWRTMSLPANRAMGRRLKVMMPPRGSPASMPSI
jgi:cytochrome c553